MSSLLPLLFAVLVSLAHADEDGVFADKDAAERVQEGDIKHWIEYYKGQRKVAPAKVNKDRDDNSAAATDAGGDRPEVPMQSSK